MGKGYRPFLEEALRRVAEGGDITNDELSAAIPDPIALEGAERKAYHGLSYWADDSDIRARDPAYGQVRRAGLKDLLRALSKPIVSPPVQRNSP